jgi:hypothetical protein
MPFAPFIIPTPPPRVPAPIPTEPGSLRALFIRAHWVWVARCQAEAWDKRRQAFILAAIALRPDEKIGELMKNVETIEAELATAQARFDAISALDSVAALAEMTNYIAGVADAEKDHETVQFEFLYVSRR